MNREFFKQPWLPMLLGLVLASGFVLFQPGRIAKDSGEYDMLAQSILTGSFEIDGEPSMVREPGYPVFRAAFYLFTNNSAVVLWAQVLLFVGIIWLAWDTLRRLDQRLAIIGSWSTALSYGLFVYASRHLLEMFATFLTALVVWLAVRTSYTERLWRELIPFAVISALLILTRASLAFIPMALLVMLVLVWKKKSAFEKIQRVGVVIVIMVALIAPWVIRNGRTFGVWSITGRTGIQVAARAFKVDEGWGRFMDSAGSVVFGKTLYSTKIDPDSAPIITEHWKKVWNRLDAWRIDRNPIEADLALRKEAFAIIFSSPDYFLRAAAWTLIDVGRLLALPSPLSPEFSIENMFWARLAERGLTMIEYSILFAAALMQLFWWIGICIGCWYGFAQYKERFFPGYLLIAVVLAHLPADNIVRYAVPIYPWVTGVALWGLLQFIERRRGFRFR